jgi:hypothetical protein
MIVPKKTKINNQIDCDFHGKTGRTALLIMYNGNARFILQ